MVRLRLFDIDSKGGIEYLCPNTTGHAPQTVSRMEE
jgi:hypothetical protein